jgi:serine phosphatase RsbU (regulator of sigma subunit)
MKLHLLARDLKIETVWREELKALQMSLGNAFEHLSEFVFVDAKKPNWQAELSELNREHHSVILVLEEKELLPNAKHLGEADDLLVHPFRTAELLSIYRHHQMRKVQKEIMHEVSLAHADVQNSNETLERILQAKTPKRYTNIKGLQVMSKHLSGLKPGGDYFDVFESSKKDFVNILLVDSSSYGISAAFLGLILSSSARIANDAELSTADWIKTIYGELKLTLGDDGHFSVFFGRLNRKDFSLHYQLFGSIEAFIVEKEGVTRTIEKNGKRMSAMHVPEYGEEKIVQLNPKDRIVLLSDGFVNGIGGEFHLQKIFHERLNQEPFALVNELSFQIKAKLSPGETFPGEDCSAIVLDIDPRVLRLAPTG